MPYDRIACLARAHTLDFRRAFKLTQMKSFSLATYEGEENCRQLVQGWVRKQAYYYQLWLLKACPAEDFSEDEHLAFEEDEDWLGWALSLPLDSPAFARATELRDWRPVLGGER